MADFPKKQQQCLIPKYLLDYTTELNKNHPDPSDPWGGGGGSPIEAGTGITITTESDDTKVISLDTNPDIFEITADTGMTLEVENSNPLWTDSKLQMAYTGATRLEGTLIDLYASNGMYFHSDSAPSYVNNTTHEYKTLATTDQLFSGDYDDLYNKPTIPDAVSGTNDGTNWTSLTIGEDTYGLASGGGTTYTAGNGIDITGSTISIDTSVVAELSDIPDVSNMVTTNTTQNITGIKTFKGEDRLVLQGTSASQKPGFAILDNNSDKRGFLELRPSTGDKTMVLGVYNNDYYTDTSTYRIGFREYNQRHSNYTYSTLMPKGSDKYTTFGSGNMNMVLGVNGQVADDSGNVSLSIPSKTSDLNNDSGYITGITSSDVTTALGYTPYDSSNPSGYITGINSSDVITALGYTPGTSNFSGSYTDLTDKPTIPTSTSQLTNDRFVRYDTASQGLSSTQKSNARTNIGAGTSNFSGDYTDLTNKPTIPTVNDPTITFTQGGVTKGTITLNQSSNQTIALDAGGSGGISEIEITITPGNTYQLTADELSKVQDGCRILLHYNNHGVDLGQYLYPVGNPTLYGAYLYKSNPVLSENSQMNIGPQVGMIGLSISTTGLASYDYDDLQFAKVARTNSYNDLDNKPDLSIYAQSANLATVATSGSYNDLSNTPTIPTTATSTSTVTPTTIQLTFTYTDNTTETVTLMTAATVSTTTTLS